MSDYAPAEVLRAALVAVGAADAPENQSGNMWPCFVDQLPVSPDRAVCVYGTTGYREGRIMKTGESIRKPGWQIRVRDVDYRLVWARVRRIQAALDTIRNLEVLVEAETCILRAVTQIGDALDMGQEPEARRRINVTINGTMTLGEPI